jgi:hypothetical protein
VGLTGSLFAQDKKEYFLYGSRETGSIRLYWDVFAWPSNLEGFNLKRRMINGDSKGEWTALNFDLLSPDIAEKEDWVNQGLSAMQAAELDSALSGYLKRGLLSISSTSEMLSILQANNGLGSGDRIRMKSDFNLALMLDFAFIDNNALDGVEYEYGLYLVRSGVESAQPIALFSTELLLPPDYQVKFQKLKQGIAINWQLERDQSEARAILGYFLYRRDPGSAGAANLLETPLGSYKEVEELLVWRYNDLLTDNRNSHEYGIAYVDMFQKMSDTVWSLYDAEFFKEVDPPIIDSIILIDGQHVKLEWQVPEASSEKALSFLVELSGDAEPGKWKFESISDTISGSSCEFTDTLFKQFGNIYFYKVALIDKYGRAWYSREKSIFYMGAIKPPRVRGLSAKAEIIEGKALVHLNWDLNSDTLTQGYLLFSDELHKDTMNELAAIGKLKGPSYTHVIPTAGGRDYTLGIAPLGRYGAVGEMQRVKVYVPLAKMPPLYTISARLDDNLVATIGWDYPNFNELKGFELYMNDKLLAGPEILGTDIREYQVKNIELRKGTSYVEFRMKAIGQGMMTELSQKQSFYLPNIELNNIKAPDSLQVELVSDSVNFFALLTWKEVDLDSLDYRGYIMYADYYREGSVQLMASLPLITSHSYLYKLPDMSRKNYTLRIAALSNKGEKGRYAQVKLSIDDAVMKNARIINPKSQSDE